MSLTQRASGPATADPTATGAPSATRRRGAGLLAAALLAAGSGLALDAAFPGRGWWPLAPIGVAGITVAARGRSAWTAGGLGLIFGLAFLIPHLAWSGVYVGRLPWFALAGFEALFLAAMTACVPAAWRLAEPAPRSDGAPPRWPSLTGGRAGRAAMVLAIGSLWVAQEAVRGRVPFGGFGWARLAFSQADSPAVGLAWLGGAPLVSAAVAVAGALLALAVSELPRARPALGRRAAASIGLVLAAVAVLAAGRAIPTGAGTTQRSAVQVAAVQGNVPRAGLDFNAERRAVLDNHAEATQRLAADAAAGRAERPDIVLWPENASDIDPLRNADAAAVIQRAADAAGVPVLVGAVLREPADKLSNAGIVWRPSSDPHPGPGHRYVKRHPAPFAEYIPYRGFFRVFSDQVDLVQRDFAAGSRVSVLPMGPVLVGDVICFEVAWDNLVRDPVRAGAQLLVVQTNNATFGRTDESVQQLAMSKLRAVETGRAVAHISTVGVSALFSPTGDQVARSGHFTQEVLQARLPVSDGLTPAVRLGPLSEWILAVSGLLLLVAGTLLGAPRRRPGAGADPGAADSTESGTA